MENTLIIIFLILLLVIFVVIAFFYFKKKNAPKTSKVEEKFTDKKTKMGNPLYVSNDPESEYFIPYTCPSGSDKARNHSGYTTFGDSFPIQGSGSQIMMLNVSDKKGKVGGHPNYSDHDLDLRHHGVNDFGLNGEFPKSHLLDGSNNRLSN